MIIEGKEVKESVRCWCGYTAYFDHIATSTRRDGKKTVIYKCISNHRMFEEINDKSKKFSTKDKESKTKRKAPIKIKTTETNTNQ